MTSIGHQTGLFDTMAGLPPSTSEQIAEAAGLHERYVREWLGSAGHRRHRRLRPGGQHLSRCRRSTRPALTRAAGTGQPGACDAVHRR